MSLFQDALSYGATETAAQAGDLSFTQKAGGAVAGAVISGLGSIYNTFASGANALGASIEELDTYKALEDLDTDWASYYQQNKNVIDIAGFVGTSLLPGSLAITALKAARAGQTTNAVGRALNFTKVRQERALNNALRELQQEGGTVFTRISKNKMATIGWEAADQVLQATAFETAVALTMNQSPVLADDNWWDIGKGIVVGAALGGGIGGTIGGLGLNAAFKSAAKQVDLASNKYNAVSGLGRVGLDGGDKAMSILDSIVKLPDEVLEADAKLSLKFPLIDSTKTFDVNVTNVLTNVRSTSHKAATENFAIAVRDMVAANDSATANAFSDFILGKMQEMKQAGASKLDMRERLGDYLENLRSVRPADKDPAYSAKDLYYFRDQIPASEQAKLISPEQLNSAVVSSAPFKDGMAYKNPYIWTGTAAELQAERVVVIGREIDGVKITSLSEAWKNGYNLAMLPDGAIRINQNSTKWRKVLDPVYDSRRYVNTRTGAVTDDTVLTAADRLPAGTTFNITDDFIELPVKGEVSRRAKMSDGWKPDQTIDWYTARHAWASKLKDSSVPRVIDIRDMSLLDRAALLPPDLRTALVIRGEDGIERSGVNLDSIRTQAKLDALQKEFESGTKDVRELAYKLNVEESWVENAIAAEFGAGVANSSTEMFRNGIARDLESYLKRENVIATYTRPAQFIDTTLGMSSQRSRLGEAARTMIDQRNQAILEGASYSGGQFVTGELAYAYRVQQAIQANKNAAGAVLGADVVARFIPLDQHISKLADSLGAGAKFLGSSNADYGDILRLASQDIGKHTHMLIQEGNDRVTSALANVSTRLLNNKAAAAEAGTVLNILRNDPGKFVFHPMLPNALIRKEIADAFGKSELYMERVIARLDAEGVRKEINFQYSDAAEFFRVHTKLNGDRLNKYTTLVNARGFNTNRDSRVVYAPPVDTNYFQHYVLVRPIEGRAFATSEVAMVFGRDAAELSKRVALIDRSQFDVITKDGSERYHKALGDYQFDQTISERNIDSALRRSGALANFFPETRGQNIVEDFLRFHQNQESKLTRNAVESLYSQQIQEIRALGSSYAETATSKFSGTLKATKSQQVNPYEDYVKTMLDVSKRSEYTFFHQANEFVDALGTRAYRALADATGKARQGLVSYEEANRIAERHGIGGMYSDEYDYFLSNAPRDRNLIKEAVAKANTLLANLVLRFDFAQSLMNVVSTPLLLSTEMASIRSLMTKDPKLVGQLAELTTVAVPGGQGAAVPSTMKLLHNAIRNFFGPEKTALLERYKTNGDIKDVLSLYHSALEDLSVSPNFKVFNDKVSAAVEKVATLTGNNWSEQFTRFVSADVMRQLTQPLVDSGRLSLQTANAYISTFVNRVQGNYISSQRPVVFQGVLGGAIGLFQTYSFNLLQQLLRHVENRDKRAIATLFGMQSGLFGLNGTPLFDAVNTHIIGNASVNQGHYDAYSVAPGLLGKEWGDWLLYGTVSAMPGLGGNWPSLYTRGDINPRHMSILPINPMDVPAIDGSLRFVGNLVNVGKNLIGGADISSTLLQGLEHNGLNRPLAGVAQMLQGHTTTSKGALISANSDFSLVANAARIAGTRPIDEAIALNQQFRMQAYKAADRDRMTALGEVVKSKLIGGEEVSEEEVLGFMRNYTKIGGQAANFNSALQEWSKQANVSAVEKLRTSVNSSEGQRLNEIMGGMPLPDYRNQAADAATGE